MKRLDALVVYLSIAVAWAFFTGIIFTYTSVYEIRVAHLDALQLVLVGTVLETSVFLFEVPTGVVADACSRRLSILIGDVLVGLGFILEGAQPCFATILLAQVLWGVGYTFTSGATDAWITDEIGEEAATQAFLRAAQLGRAGGLLGILAGVVLAGWGLQAPIVVGGALFILLAGWLAVYMPESGFHPAPRQERSPWKHMLHIFQEGLQATRQRPELLDILWIGLCYGLYSEGFDRLWTLSLLERFQLPGLGLVSEATWFGILRAVAAVVSIGAVEVVRRHPNWQAGRSLVRLLLILTALLTSALLTYAWGGYFALALLAYWLVTAVRSLIDPLYTAWVNRRLDPAVRATVLSMSSQVDALGQIAGGPLVGWVGRAFSVRAALSLSAGLLTLALGLFAGVLHRERQA